MTTVDAATLRAKVEVTGADKGKSDLKSVGDQADKSKSQLSGMGSGFDTLKKAFLGGLGAIGGALTGLGVANAVGDAFGFLKDQMLDVLQAGMDQQKIDAQTAAVIKSTGAAAGLSADQIGDMADSLARLTGISDDDVQSAENILLTFKAIKKDAFEPATQSVLDMSVALHQDLQQSAILVGKALQDPILGVTALRRVGVQLSDSQVDLVKKFMATGQQAKAQAVILGELQSEFGGSAKAAGQTLPGELARLNVSFDQVREKVGLAVIPVLQSMTEKYLMPAADWLGDHLPAAIDTLTNILDNELVPAIDGIMNSPVVTTLEGWAQVIVSKVTPAMGNAGLAGHTNTAKTAVKNLNDQMGTTTGNMSGRYATNVQKAIDKVDNLTTSLGGDVPTEPGLNPAIKRVNANLDKMDSKLNASAKASQQAQQPTKFLGGVFDGLGDAIHGAGDAIGQFGDDVNTRLPGALPQIQRFGGYLGSVFGKGGVLDGLQTTWNGFWSLLSAPVKIAFDQVHTDFNVGLDVLQGDWDQAGIDAQNGIKQTGQDALDALKGVGQILIGPFEAIGKGWEQAIVHFPDLLPPDLKQRLDSIIPNLEQTIYDWSHLIQNYINDHMPTFPSIGLPNVGIPGFGGHAAGTPSAPPGLAWVGEHGPELMAFRGGERVYSHQQSVAMATAAQNNSGLARGGQIIHNYNFYGSDYSYSMQLAQDVRKVQNRYQLLTGMGR